MVLYAFFTDGKRPQQFEELPSLMVERKCDMAQLYSLRQGRAFSLERMCIWTHVPNKTNSKRTLFSQHTAQLK